MSSKLVAGIDVGAATTKIVVMDGGSPVFSIRPTGHDIKQAVASVVQETLGKKGLSVTDLEYTVSTGLGRANVEFADKAVTEIICHARGVHYLVPQCRTIIDIGGQDSKVISVDPAGNVTDFIMNDKCAAGTGRFLEVMAHVLDLKLEDLGSVSMTSRNPSQISSTCTVFAETEVVSLRAEGKKREDLVAGIHRSIVSRIMVAASRIRFSPAVVLTGGVAKNTGVRRYFQDRIGTEIVIPPEPQITGALGAALIAQAELNNCKD